MCQAARSAPPRCPGHQLTLAPSGRVVPVPGERTLLEAAEAAGLRLPSLCRNGTCRECRCRMLAGDVRYRIEWPGLSREEKVEGWVLPCVALAESDVTLLQPSISADDGEREPRASA